MSKITSFHPDLVAALTELVGTDLRNIRRVVIDINSGDGPIVYVEQFGDERLINVISAMAKVEVQIERG